MQTFEQSQYQVV